MLIVNLDELKKAKELIDRINSVPLDRVVWQENGNTIEVNAELIRMWKFTGLSNNWFAYSALLSNTIDNDMNIIETK